MAGWDDCAALTQPLPGGSSPLVVDDGAGGAIILQKVDQSGSNDVFWATRIDANDVQIYNFQFPTGGYVMSDAFAMAPKGDGGAFVIYRSGSATYVRTFNGSGTLLGPPRELADDPTPNPTPVAIISDNNGGAWAGFQTSLFGDTGNSFLVSHINPLGGLDFTSTVYDFTNDRHPGDFDLDAHAGGNLYLAYEVFPENGAYDSDVFVYAIDLTGTILFGANGTEVVADTGTDQRDPAIAVLDNEHSVVIFSHETSYSGLYAQKFGPAGSFVWDSAGKAVHSSNQPLNIGGRDIVADGLGGVVVGFANSDDPLGRNGIIAQRLDPFGTRMWTEGGPNIGKLITTEVETPHLLFHGAGSAMLAWDVEGQGTFFEAIDSAGNQMWPDEDLALCGNSGLRLVGLCPDASSGALVVGYDGQTYGKHMPWAILDPGANEAYDIIAGSQSTGFRPTDAGIFEVVFNWKTYGVTNPFHDYVEFAGEIVNAYNCWLDFGESITLKIPGVGVTARVMPAPDGSTLHELVWSRKTCEFPCKYQGNAFSGDSSSVSDGIRVRLSIQQCPDDPGGKSSAVTFSGATPNPFNPQTTMKFYVPANSSDVSLRIYNVRGKMVREFNGHSLGSGWNELTWYGRDNEGAKVSSGVYFAKLKVDGQFAIQKLSLLK